MTRDELIDAAYHALIARYPVGETYWKVVEATVDVVEPLIRADERERCESLARTLAQTVSDDLRVKVEALPTDQGCVLRHDVLALIDGTDQ